MKIIINWIAFECEDSFFLLVDYIYDKKGICWWFTCDCKPCLALLRPSSIHNTMLTVPVSDQNDIFIENFIHCTSQFCSPEKALYCHQYIHLQNSISIMDSIKTSFKSNKIMYRHQYRWHQIDMLYKKKGDWNQKHINIWTLFSKSNEILWTVKQ